MRYSRIFLECTKSLFCLCWSMVRHSLLLSGSVSYVCVCVYLTTRSWVDSISCKARSVGQQIVEIIVIVSPIVVSSSPTNKVITKAEIVIVEV